MKACRPLDLNVNFVSLHKLASNGIVLDFMSPFTAQTYVFEKNLTLSCPEHYTTLEYLLALMTEWTDEVSWVLAGVQLVCQRCQRLPSSWQGLITALMRIACSQAPLNPALISMSLTHVHLRVSDMRIMLRTYKAVPFDPERQETQRPWGGCSEPLFPNQSQGILVIILQYFPGNTQMNNSLFILKINLSWVRCKLGWWMRYKSWTFQIETQVC